MADTAAATASDPPAEAPPPEEGAAAEPAAEGAAEEGAAAEPVAEGEPSAEGEAAAADGGMGGGEDDGGDGGSNAVNGSRHRLRTRPGTAAASGGRGPVTTVSVGLVDDDMDDEPREAPPVGGFVYNPSATLPSAVLAAVGRPPFIPGDRVETRYGMYRKTRTCSATPSPATSSPATSSPATSTLLTFTCAFG